MALDGDVKWLDDTEQRAWQGLIALNLLALPEMERTFREYGLVHVEYGLLHELSQRPEGLRHCDLAVGMKVSQSRLSHRMNKLRERGLVEVLPSAHDGRVSLAFITDKGRRLLEEIAPRHVADVRRLVFDRLSPSQVGALADAMGTIAEHLRACPEDPCSPCPDEG